MIKEIKNGDLVNFGQYGNFYIVNANFSAGYYWISDEPGETSGWAIPKSFAEKIINK